MVGSEEYVMGVELYAPPACVACDDRAWIDLSKWDLGCWCAPCLHKALDSALPSPLSELRELDDEPNDEPEGGGSIRA